MEMKECRFKLISTSPILFCRYHDTEKREGETPFDHEVRTWRERCHYNEDGLVIVPGYMIQKSFEEAGKSMGERVGGKKTGKALHGYLSGVRVVGDCITDKTREDIECLTAFVSSNGQVGGPKVSRNYPKVNKWKGIFTFAYPDLNILNNQIIHRYLDIAGTCIGIGHWRPGAPSKGSYGMFKVKKIKVKKIK